ncbi:ECF transporter S component [Candidatus Bathyarchaeota archaeon]|nr:ECF transporter S component [Candidatus Bathyarchaeota archaeon]
MNARLIGIAMVSTALTVIMTCIMFPMPKPLGYVNLGEIAIFLSAILFGPFIGAFSGGVGSMIADIALGYYAYAPATLLIKGFEGFIVGYLRKINEIAAMLVGSASMIFGYFLFDYALYGPVAWLDLIFFAASLIRISISYLILKALKKLPIMKRLSVGR